ncbi:hypothetical protein GCM10022226_72780 [Sphaerisporangium flaviroseum]|uniref:HTH marR-type domain-containing protein n=1 Tax=Sphaerisporangium flaviroseum TaxID=509199 RepID=A0ABP7JBU8_9ACTN
MSELALACDLSLSGMTRLVTRLEAGGLVERVQCAEDARGYKAVLTDAGLARLEEAYPSHLAGIRRHIVDHVDPAALPVLTQTMERIGVPAAEIIRSNARS